MTTKDPVVKPLGELEFKQPMGVKNLRTAHPWGLRIDGVDYIVPAAMETDGMSISRFLWRVVDPPFYSLAVPGVILHDAGYGGLLRAIDSEGDLVELSKDDVDDLLYIAARWNGYSAWKAWTVYEAVKIGGGKAWRNSHARNSEVNLDLLDYDWTRGGLFPSGLAAANGL